ncbi:Bug family tripartite tricarboxylate transporter substrate binding protein [Cupriavidus basilensis]
MSTSSSRRSPVLIENDRRQFMKYLGALGVAPLGTALSSTTALAASGYPDKPIRMVHAFSAGSGTDTTGRILAEGLTKSLHQSVVVENRPGASMMIGTGFAAKQPPDGYTMLMVTLDSLGLNPYLYRNISYKVSDFDPVTLVGEIPLVLVGAPNLPYANFEELAKASQHKKKEYSLGTWGYGSVGHVVGVTIASQTPLKFEYVPFQGAAPAAQAIMGGHVELSVITPQSAAELVKAGRAKAFAVGGEKRLADLPNVPSFKELGFPQLRAMQWHGVAVRAGGNASIIDKLYANCQAVLKDPAMAAKLLQVGYTKIDGRSPKDFAAFIASESAAWGEIVKASIPPINN